jgi:hypothetical protein
MHLARAVAAIMAVDVAADRLFITRKTVGRDRCGACRAGSACGPGRRAKPCRSGSPAALLGGTAEVTPRRPVPLDRSLPVHRDGGGVLVVESGDVLLAEARPAESAISVWSTPTRCCSVSERRWR